MTYSSNYTNRATIFDNGDTIEGDHVKAIYDELGATPAADIAAGKITSGILTDSWYANPLQAVSTALTFPTINRIYYDPWFVSEEQTITAVGVDMTTAGDASNVLRIAIFDDNGSHGAGTLLAQSTVAGDGIAKLTWTLGTPQAVGPGIFWVAVGPQGSGSPGAIRGALIDKPFSVDLGESGASFANTYAGPSLVPARFENASGTLSSSPTLVLEANNRHPWTVLRFQ